MTTTAMAVVVAAVPLRRLAVFGAQPLQHLTLHGILKVALVGKLLLPLDGQQRVVADLGDRVALGNDGRRAGAKVGIGGRVFLELLIVAAREQRGDSAFAEQIGLGLLLGPARTAALGRTAVEELDAVEYLFAARRFLDLAQLLQLPLLLTLLAPLLCALALFKRLLFFLPDTLLVLLQPWVPGFFQIQVLDVLLALNRE